MAASPEFKIYNPAGEYEAACKHAETAAAIVSFLGHGSAVKWHHTKLIWTEGVDGKAGESYDAAATTMYARITEYGEAKYRENEKHRTLTYYH
jgi:hypothetical protein